MRMMGKALLKPGLALGALALTALSASPAAAHYRTTRCDRDGDRCWVMLCDDDGDDCRTISEFRSRDARPDDDRWGDWRWHAQRGWDRGRRGHWICDGDGDDCHWVNNWACDPFGEHCRWTGGAAGWPR